MGKKARNRAAARLAQHIVERQIEPQLLARELQEQGIDCEAAMVDMRPQAEGFEVECVGCGRKAKLLQPMPAGAVAMCPLCTRAAR